MQPITIKLRMLTRGPNGNRVPGEIVDVDPARAALLVLHDHAEPVNKPRAATVGPPERAVMSGAKK